MTTEQSLQRAIAELESLLKWGIENNYMTKQYQHELRKTITKCAKPLERNKTMDKIYLQPGDHIEATSTVFSLIKSSDGSIDLGNCHVTDASELKYWINDEWMDVYWDFNAIPARLYYISGEQDEK